MSSLRLMWIEPALVRLMTLGKNSCLAKTSTAVALLLLVAAAAPRAFAQEKTWGDSGTPLVFNVENTGANTPAPNFADFAHLPIVRPLPDAFRFANGTRDESFGSWERRRNEMLAAIEKYELGPKPDCHDCTITASYTPPASGSSTGSLTVNVTRNGKTLTLTSGVYIPQGMGSGPFPALIPMELGGFSFGGQTFNFPPPPQPDYASLPASVFQGTPIATVGYVLTQVAGYAFTAPSDHTKDPFYLLYPELCAGTCMSGGNTITSNSSEYAAWAWGVSRLIDGMAIASKQSVNPMPIDMSHIAVTGCSYAGKMALISGALDERVALTIAQENGGGGAPSWRVSHEIEAQGTVEDIDDTNYDWWSQQMQQFSGDNVYKLPTDHEELMALVAPRALLETGNTDFYWLSNRSNLVASRATQQIYNAFGIGDRFGFYIDGGHQHCATLPAEAPAISSFVNKFMLGQSGANSDVEVLPTAYANLDTSRWTWWWGKQDPNSNPKFPNDWTMGGNFVMDLNGVDGLLGFIGLPGSVRINTNSTVNTGYQFSVKGKHDASTVSLSGGYVEADVSCIDGTSYTMTVPVPDGNTAIPTNSSWAPSPQVWQGSATAPGCKVSTEPGLMADAYFSALGHNNGVGNPPLNPGVTSTDTTDPLSVRFACNANGQTSQQSQPMTVNFNQ